MINVDFIEVVRRSFTMIILIFCSIMALTFAIERWWYFRKIRLDVENFMAALKRYIEEGNFKEALNLCKSSVSPIARTMEVAIMNHQKSKAIFYLSGDDFPGSCYDIGSRHPGCTLRLF